MKKYLITIKKIEKTSMMVSETSRKKAIEKVDKVLKEYVKKNISLDKTFTNSPFFVYKAELIRK